MKYLKALLTKELHNFFKDDLCRIQHALDVLKHAENIMTEIKEADPEIVIAAALLHDTGIKISEAELGYNNGKTQEKYGPETAAKILKNISFPEKKSKIVKEIISNHHSPDRFSYPELQILKKADKIVNRGSAGKK